MSAVDVIAYVDWVGVDAAPLLAPGDVPMDVNLAVELYWPCVYPSGKERG